MGTGSLLDYRNTHRRVVRARGAARTYPCANPEGRTTCKGQALEWAYTHTDPTPLVYTHSNGNAIEYSTNVGTYIPLCRSCHRYMDRFRGDGWNVCAMDSCTTRTRAEYCAYHVDMAARGGPAWPGRHTPLGYSYNVIDEYGRVRPVASDPVFPAPQAARTPGQTCFPLPAGQSVASDDHEPVAQKWCYKCNKTKAIHAFALDRSKKDGHATKCLPCDRELARAKYRKKKGLPTP
jgi:hypothetical protein